MYVCIIYQSTSVWARVCAFSHEVTDSDFPGKSWRIYFNLVFLISDI